MLSGLREAVRSPVESAYAAAASVPIVDSFIGSNGVVQTRGLFLNIPSTVNSTVPGVLNLGNLTSSGGLLGSLLGETLDLDKIKGLLVDVLVTVTELPVDLVLEFVDVLELITDGVGGNKLYRSDVKDALVQSSILKNYAALSPEQLTNFRSVLANISGKVPESPGDGKFNESLDLNLLSGVKDSLLSNQLLGSDTGLVKLAKTYVESIFPLISDVAQTDSLLSDFQDTISGIFSVDDFPLASLVNIVKDKFDLMNADILNGGEIVPLASVIDAVTSLAQSLIEPVSKLLEVIPVLAVESAFELATLIKEMTETSVENIKLAALRLLSYLPTSEIDVLKSVDVADLADLTDNPLLGPVKDIIAQIQNYIDLYADMIIAIGVETQMFTIENFAQMALDLISQMSAFSPLTDVVALTE